MAIGYSENLDAVFSGGYSESFSNAWAMRVDAADKTVRWRRHITAGATAQTITAIQVNPQGTKVALVGTQWNNSPLDASGPQVFINVVRAEDGGFLYRQIAFQYDSNIRLEITKNAMVYTSSNKIYMALKQMNSDKSLVISVDPANEAVDWAHEQAGVQGVSGVLIYKNYCATCANLFIGGNVLNFQ